MKFRSEIKLGSAQGVLSHSDAIFSMGSCFAETMAEKLAYYKFKVLSNPFGNLFNALSIENAIARIYVNNSYTEEELFSHNGLYHSWDHHSSFSAIEQEEILTEINKHLHFAHNFLQNAQCVILTFGSSYVYVLKQLNMPVANCHKVPNSQFDKKLCLLPDTLSSIQNSIDMVKEMAGKEVKIILTLSPVRYLKDGLVENQRSKSILVEALHQIEENNVGVSYFPSYEMLVDDLRDYRFYKEDLAHPTAMAEEYVWRNFSEHYFTSETKSLNKEIDTIQKELAHKPFVEESEENQRRLQLLQEKIQTIEKTYPYIKF